MDHRAFPGSSHLLKRRSPFKTKDMAPSGKECSRCTKVDPTVLDLLLSLWQYRVRIQQQRPTRALNTCSAEKPPTHVSKHFVVPVATSEQSVSSQNSAEPHPGSRRLRHRNYQHTGTIQWPRICHPTESGPYLIGPHEEAQHQNRQLGGLNCPPTCLSAGMDSVLYQQHYALPASDFVTGQYIPTALQPMWPPCGGATSMDKPGPTGPYWPNGAYEPYRPAPFQNTSLSHRGDCNYYSSIDSHSHAILPATIDHHNVHDTFLPDSLKDQIEHRFVDRRKSCDTALPFGKDLPTSNLVSNGQPDPDLGSVVSPIAGFDQYDTRNAVGHSTPGHDYLQGSNDIQLKYRVLLWAHRVYLNLLSTLDTSPRISPISQQLTKHRHRHQLYVPAQSYERLSDGQSVQKSFSDHLQSRVDRHTNGTYLAQTPRVSRDFGHQTGPGPSIQGLPNKVHNLALGLQSETSHYEHPATAAVTAIEILNRLCQESEWRWSEGMLLGGCLAYGLGDYNSAYKWYTRLLSRDSR